MTKSNNTLPHGWSSLPINEVFDFIGTSSFSRNDLNYEVDEECIYYIHYGDIHATYKNAVLDFNTETRIPVLNKNIKPSTHLLKEGDLIIADASEDYEGVGEALEVYNIGDKKVLAGLHTFALRDKDNKTAHGYRAYLFKNPEVKKRLKTIATGSKVYGISKGNLEKFKITLPPFVEQEKIANILATWDKAIGLQEKLIAYKKENKRAVMKMLLNGEVRFKSDFGIDFFNWEMKKLGEIFSILNGYAFSSDDATIGGVVWVKIADVGIQKMNTENQSFLPLSFVEKHKKFILKKGDYVIALTRPILNGELKVAAINDTFNNSLLNQRVGKLVTENNLAFIYYLLQTKRLIKSIENNISGTDPPNLSSKEIDFIKIKIPSKSEQEKIANFLLSIDKEINLLENEFIAFKNQKQGLMQHLLSGKIRVKN